MSEVQSRPSAPRGRSSARGGRGGHRGITRSSNKQTNGDRASSTAVDHTADEGELAELKGQYKTQLTTLKELFPDWTDMDLLLGLNDCNGDLEATIERITEGNVSQFSEVHKKTKDRSRSKVKESPAGGDSSATSRGARSRAGQEGTRGTRGRGDRGRGGLRGSRGGTHTTTNGARSTDASVPTTESSAYANNDTEADGVEGTPEGQQDSAPKPTLAKASEAQKAKAVPAEPPKKTWASMFAKPKPAPAPAKPAAQPPVSKEPPKPQPEAPTHDIPVEPVQPEQVTAPLIPENVDVPEPTPPPETLEVTDSIQEDVAALELTPSKDQLTEDNVEHLPDVSRPAPTETAASTVASDSVAGIATPLSTSQQAPIGRSALGGYATTAHKATMQQGRSVSYQRRLFEQQEAVVMPGNHAVDRAAVQFGNFKLNGDVESPLDVDEDREEAETRTQPPQHSPTAQPRTSLPPVPRQAQVPAELAAQEPAAPVTKPAPGLPPVPQAQQQPVGAQQSPQNPIATQAMTQQGSQGSQQYSQFGRYNQPGAPTEPAAAQQKQYDPFANQNPQQSQYDNFSGQSQTGNQQQQAQSGLGAYSSAPNDYPSFYTADQRAAYQNYYNAYNQQGSVNQEAGQSQQRSGSAFGSNPTDSTFSTTQAPSGPSRYGETQNSGQNTPNPTGQNQSQSQHMHPQAHTQSGHGAGYAGYNHPYYQSAYYQNYMSQYGGYGNQGFGPYGKGSMYGQPHHGYGMSPQTPYDQHSSSPANAGSFGQSSMHGREGLLGGGFSDYGRSGSTQPSSTGQHSATNAGFSGTSDTFSRTQGGFPGQSQQYGQQQQTNQQASNEESLKPFGESKTSSGPSPALGQPGRPGSATNTASAQANQTGLPPTQSHQQGFGQYPSHLGNQGNQYGALGGLGGHQSGPQNYQAGGYGYGGGFGANQYGNRGGWGANFSGHQNH